MATARGQEYELWRLESWQDRHLESFCPSLTCILVERCAAETVTKGGIMLPEKSQGKVMQAVVVAVGLQRKG